MTWLFDAPLWVALILGALTLPLLPILAFLIARSLLISLLKGGRRGGGCPEIKRAVKRVRGQ